MPLRGPEAGYPHTCFIDFQSFGVNQTVHACFTRAKNSVLCPKNESSKNPTRYENIGSKLRGWRKAILLPYTLIDLAIPGSGSHSGILQESNPLLPHTFRRFQKTLGIFLSSRNDDKLTKILTIVTQIGALRRKTLIVCDTWRIAMMGVWIQRWM